MRIIFLFILLLVMGAANSQNVADTLTLESNFKGFKFIYHGEEIKAKEVESLMETNELAYDEFLASREAYAFGNVFGVIGGGLILFPFVSSALGNEPNYGPAFAGLCFIGIAIPIFMAYNKKTISSIVKYNSGLQPPQESRIQSKLYFGASTSGIGFQLVY